MHLNAAIVLQGLSDFTVDDVSERIRCVLHDIDPNLVYVGVEVQSVGSDFGFVARAESIDDLLIEAEHRRRDLLQQFWMDRCQRTLLASQRVAHAMGTMNPVRIRAAIARTDVFPGL